jgi:hypothetical protein
MTATAAKIDIPYSRTLLNEVKLGKGTALKQLRDAIAANPSVKKSFEHRRRTEEDNLTQRRNMMWVKDATSRVKRVDTVFRDQCTYTNPMHTNEVPNRTAVVRAKEERTAAATRAASQPPPSFFV